MTDRTILFSPPMVLVLLAGRKTQTRRLMRNPEFYGCPTGDCPHDRQAQCDAAMNALTAKETGYAVGDRLWVREAWRTAKVSDELKPSQLVGGGYSPIWYEVDRDNCDEHGRYRHARFMPRMTLTVEDVRVQRLQDIDAADARAEGIEEAAIQHFGCPIKAYAALWNHLHGAENDTSWEANPWVVAISFSVEHRNINA